MGQALEFDGQRFDTVGEFMDALAHEYKVGDKELVVTTLEDYGYTLADLHVRPGGGNVA